MAAQAHAYPPKSVETELLLDCVHCGFCLEACPTYQLTRAEMDSPRGRVYTIKALMEGEVELIAPVVQHLDLCLGCRACETACPSGVHYGRIIEQARAHIEAHYRRPLSERIRRWAVGTLFPYPRRLRIALAPMRLIERLGLRPAVTRIAPRALREWIELLPALSAHASKPPTPRAHAGDQAVAIHPGCVTQVLADSANRSTAQILADAGYRVNRLDGAVCCGALDLHSGNLKRARRFARANVRRFARGTDFIISTASGCSTAMAEYGELLKDDPELAALAAEFSRKVTELSRLLAGKSMGPMRLDRTATYHDACHLAHGMGVREEPRKLLRAIQGLKLVEMENSDTCCGSAGSYNLTQPQAAQALGRRKVDAIQATGADFVVMSNPGCQFQIAAELSRRGSNIKAIHLADFLALALHQGGPKDSPRH